MKSQKTVTVIDSSFIVDTFTQNNLLNNQNPHCQMAEETFD